MPLNWLQPKYFTFIEKKNRHIPKLVLIPFNGLPPRISGWVGRMMGTELIPFQIMTPNPKIATIDDIATLLGLALLDSKITLINSTFMPFRTGLACLRNDGSIRHQVIRTYDNWALQEILRLSLIFRSKYSHMLENILLVAKERKGGILPPAPPNLPMITKPGEAFEIKLPTIQVNTNELDHIPGNKERHMVVRYHYERDRYLSHLSEGQLFQRAHDCIINSHQLNKEGKISLDIVNDQRIFWWLDRFTEVLHEIHMRGFSPQYLRNGIKKEFPYPSGTDIPQRASKCVQDINVPNTPYLVKYGKSKHLKDILKGGNIRLMPAHSYADPSLNLARQDDELSQELDFDTSVFQVMINGMKTSKPRFRVRADMKSNFYVFCLSSSLRARLFLDFDADACLIIKDSDAFSNRFFNACRNSAPEYHFKAGRVEYYDPLCVSPEEFKPIFWKHFRYAYQEEVRFVLLPPKPRYALDPLFLKLGSIEDIAHLAALK